MIDRFYSTLTQYRPSVSVGVYGEPVESLVLVGDVRGVINKTGPKESALYADKYQVEDIFHCYTEITDIKNLDVLVFSGVSYRVLSNSKNTIQRNHHLKLILERLDSDV